ncbi:MULTISPECIES: Holliday junction branch migration protein RuvA [Halocynthiibacter]|uniref:Holliday junction branch migration complex subunit RuvA n=1 Tax=Halocynthiibacter halioticoli TaxID=2986804 RepID=A0AAE3LS90_9RHOB|nr:MULTISPECIES: Holliday junction branch migration protein RuvA [Halocynthiibacter]MCV6825299.1 Holliday junction branch migration protein RuvA [Halocynthiibacter halioticoli]MCW4058300.1 Holliday junction branch migration protein RuvA [Halocynthiibacter sp. SDUM655004]
MIGKISGRLEYRSTDHVMIDVRGVGYLVYVTERTMAALPQIGEQVALYTELLVREDNLQLFGFTSLIEKEWHRLLVSVQGVGAKASMAILGTIGAEGVGRAISLGDWNAVKAAKGVGPKTAQRIVLELKEKAPNVMALGGTLADAEGIAPAAPSSEDVVEVVEPAPKRKSAPSSAAAQSEALSALTNLGYNPSEAASAVAQAASDTPEAQTTDLIRAALRLLAPKG